MNIWILFECPMICCLFWGQIPKSASLVTGGVVWTCGDLFSCCPSVCLLEFRRSKDALRPPVPLLSCWLLDRCVQLGCGRVYICGSVLSIVTSNFFFLVCKLFFDWFIGSPDRHGSLITMTSSGEPTRPHLVCLTRAKSSVVGFPLSSPSETERTVVNRQSLSVSEASLLLSDSVPPWLVIRSVWWKFHSSN